MMSFSPLSGIKILDLSRGPDPSPAVAILGRWGAELRLLPQSRSLDLPDARRLLLRYAQETDVLVSAGHALDVALLHEYNPMLIVCTSPAEAAPWETTSAVLAALRERDRSGLGQHVMLAPGTPPCFRSCDAFRL